MSAASSRSQDKRVTSTRGPLIVQPSPKAVKIDPSGETPNCAAPVVIETATDRLSGSWSGEMITSALSVVVRDSVTEDRHFGSACQMSGKVDDVRHGVVREHPQGQGHTSPQRGAHHFR